MQEKLLILDFGSQYTQLIARRVRELNIYCEIHPYHNIPKAIDSFKAVILSGSPFSVRAEDAPHPDLSAIRGKKTLIGDLLRGTILIFLAVRWLLPINASTAGQNCT